MKLLWFFTFPKMNRKECHQLRTMHQEHEALKEIRLLQLSKGQTRVNGLPDCESQHGNRGVELP
jgi:hypothetical protein